MYRLGVAILYPILGLLIHELTHLAVVKYQVSRSGKTITVFPQLHFKISYLDTQPDRDWQLMAIAPFVVGVITVVALVIFGVWHQIQLSVPYYIEGVLLLIWILYSHLSPADVRTLLNPNWSHQSP